MNYELGVKEDQKFHNSLFSTLYSPKFLLFSVKISGESMWPRLVPGKKYLATNLLAPRVGDAIVFRNPKNEQQTLVKEIKEKSREGYCVVGLNRESISSEKIGIVSRQLVIGKLLA